MPNLGEEIEIYVDSDGYADSSRPAWTAFKATVVAVHMSDPRTYIVGWKAGSSNIPRDARTIDLWGSPKVTQRYHLAAGCGDYCRFLESNQIKTKDEKKMTTPATTTPAKKPLFVNFRLYATDATWRQTVERAVELAHERLMKNAGGALSNAQAKTLSALLGTAAGKHAMSFALGLALEYVPPMADPRVARLAKELQIYGLEFVAGRVIRHLEALVHDLLSIMPPVEEAASTAAQ